MHREHYDGRARVNEAMSGTGGSLRLPVPRDLTESALRPKTSPHEPDLAATAQPRATIGQRGSPDAAGDLPHVLIVDGDAGTRSVLAGYLERHQMRVTPAADGEMMWAVVKHQLIDLLILDIDLRGVDGLSLCRMLRMGSQIPIMLTGRADEVDPIVGFEF